MGVMTSLKPSITQCERGGEGRVRTVWRKCRVELEQQH